MMASSSAALPSGMCADYYREMVSVCFLGEWFLRIVPGRTSLFVQVYLALINTLL
jgi:hypothetical protein